MPVREFHIAPDPDTVIVLRSPCVNFASWEEVVAPVDKVTKGEEIADGWGFPAPIRKKKSKRRREESVSEPNSLFGSDAGNTSYPELGPAGDTVTEGTVASPGLSKDENHSNDVPAIFAQDEQQISDEAARYYVSFRHLITASPCFHRMLTKDKWNESERDKKDGLFHLSAEDWDVYAFLLLLNILHLKNRQVPRKVSLDDLAKIAVLVDYYECAEAIELFSDMWIQYLIKVVPIPSEYCRPLVLWIWIAWVFERAHEFKNATLVAIKQCSKPICTLGLPIPDRVSENIDIRRYQFIEHTIEGLHSLRDKYKSLEYECPSNRSTDDSFECGSLLYGGITKGMLAIKLISPRPEIPFKDMSFEKLCGDVREMKSLACHKQYGKNGRNYYSQDSCNLKAAVTAIVENVDRAVTGLNLVSLKAHKSVGQSELQ